MTFGVIHDFGNLNTSIFGGHISIFDYLDL